MPSASPLCPNVLSDLDRYPHPCECAVPEAYPVTGPKLQSDYDPFKFLSAMAEQSLTGNFASHHSCAHAPQPGNSGSHFLFCTTSQLSQSPNGFASPPAMTSSPPQFYGASQPQTSSGCCMYTNSSGSQYSCASGSGVGGDGYDVQHQQQHRQQLPLLGCEGERRAAGRGDITPTSAKKNFLCPSDLMDTSEDGESLLSWTRHHPEHWTRTQVLDWLFFVAQERGLDMQELRGEAFQSVTGGQLCRMSLDDFGRLEPKYGLVLYQMFKKLLAGVLFTKPSGDANVHPAPAAPNGTDCTELTSSYSAVSCNLSQDSLEGAPIFHNFHMTSKAPCLEFLPPPDGHWKQERPDWPPERSQSLQSDVIDIESYDFDFSDPPSIPNHAAMEACPSEYEVYVPNYPSSAPMNRTSCYFPPCPYPPPLPRRRPGRPRVKSLPEDDERSSKDKKAKNQHLWEFIYETLLNPLYNPQFLRWENQREGVFRFVQSEAVAQLWGSRKNNENMTYEKLSRAMRHYYKRGILERVEGRRLVYKFSRKAIDRVRELREKWHATV